MKIPVDTGKIVFYSKAGVFAERNALLMGIGGRQKK
jgi:hypothetical protein